jgi:5-methylthioadenosine/S-adenosylhomocysteine deaminase
MTPADLLITARWIIPVEPAGAVLEDHALVVDQGRIRALLPAAEALARYAPRTRLDRPHHALLPGLVNAHTHAAMTLFRGLADDLPLETWLGEHIWPAESRWVTPDFVRDGTELAVLEMIRGGTTCFSDMYFFPDVVARTAAEQGIRATVGMIVLEFPTVWAQDPEDYIRKGLAVHDQYRGHPLVQVGFAPHAPYTVSDGTFQRVRVLADELDTPVQMHVHETATEVADSRRDHGRRPLRRLDDLGLVSPLLSAVHATQLEDGEIALLKARGASVVHCAESNQKLASGTCPVAALHAAGVNVALGTDGAASNNDLDMFGEMRSCALLAKGTTGDARALPAATVLEMATLGGARALGLADRIGSLVPGKEADFICVNLGAPATQPVHHPLSTLVYAAGRDQVTDTWVSGRPLLAEGRPVVADEPDILDRASAWSDRLAGRP